MLWLGEPGTGKTYALRALVWEWRRWADFHYIVDPDKFFGDHASYMATVLFHEHDESPPVLVSSDPHRQTGEEDPGAPVDRWKVLILEDSGELLAADAKQQTGQALSRLLNVVDGMIGQGLRVLVLVTTNDEIKQMNPAVQRPGRCASKVEFGPLSAEEARDWLAAREYAGPEWSVKGMTLAELYALVSGHTVALEPLVGFAA